MINPDDLAIGVVLRNLAMRIARLEQPNSAKASLKPIRESCMDATESLPISGASETEAIMIRAQAQAIIEHLLDD